MCVRQRKRRELSSRNLQRCGAGAFAKSFPSVLKSSCSLRFLFEWLETTAFVGRFVYLFDKKIFAVTPAGTLCNDLWPDIFLCTKHTVRKSEPKVNHCSTENVFVRPLFIRPTEDQPRCSRSLDWWMIHLLAAICVVIESLGRERNFKYADESTALHTKIYYLFQSTKINRNLWRIRRPARG